MLEDTPTMGSICTSTYEKRRMAKESAEFNLNDEIFVELFPDVVQVSPSLVFWSGFMTEILASVSVMSPNFFY